MGLVMGRQSRHRACLGARVESSPPAALSSTVQDSPPVMVSATRCAQGSGPIPSLDPKASRVFFHHTPFKTPVISNSCFPHFLDWKTNA